MSDHTNRDVQFRSKFYDRHVGGYNDAQDKNQHLEQQLENIEDNDRYLPPRLRYDQSFMLGQRRQIAPTGVNFNNHGMNMNPNRANSISLINSGLGCTDGSCGGSSGGLNGVSGYNAQSIHNNGGRTPHDVQTFVDTRPDVYLRRDQDKFNPYNGFLYDKGLMNDGTQLRRYDTIYIDINSEYRSRKPSLNIQETFILRNNPIRFTENSTRLIITQPNHPFEINDPITIENVFGRIATLRTFDEMNNATFDIPVGGNFMKVFFEHGVPPGKDDDVQVQISGIQGNRESANKTQYLGSIPVNIINSTHVLKTTLSIPEDQQPEGLPPDYFNPSPDYFFVQFNRRLTEGFTLRDYNFKLRFLAIAGIPINKINARYPIDPLHLKGFHIIKNTTRNTYEIDIDIRAFSTLDAGGNCVTIGQIEAVNTGFPNANCYTVSLGRTYHNIISARMVSSEIPNTERAIRDFPTERVNNKIYWNTIDDGDFLYNICIPNGNYTPESLSAVIETLFLNTDRQSSGADVGGSHTERHFMQVEINTNTDNVEFSLFKENILNNPISQVVPGISTGTDPEQVIPGETYQLVIEHPGHGMTETGETILIQGAISHLGIPPETINQSHQVVQINSEDEYVISLPPFNLLPVREDTGGGVNVGIFIPDLFRLRFDQPDTMGRVLGFRDPGDPSSITPFARTISNKDPYEFEQSTNAFGETIVIENNALKMAGENYIVMVAEPLETFNSISNVKNAFAKILLCDLPGRILFNTFVPTVHHFKDPLHELSELEIKFLSPDGSLFDFNGCDHSFTLELVTVNDIPEGSGINANTGKNYNIIS